MELIGKRWLPAVGVALLVAGSARGSPYGEAPLQGRHWRYFVFSGSVSGIEPDSMRRFTLYQCSVERNFVGRVENPVFVRSQPWVEITTTVAMSHSGHHGVSGPILHLGEHVVLVGKIADQVWDGVADTLGLHDVAFIGEDGDSLYVQASTRVNLERLATLKDDATVEGRFEILERDLRPWGRTVREYVDRMIAWLPRSECDWPDGVFATNYWRRRPDCEELYRIPDPRRRPRFSTGR